VIQLNLERTKPRADALTPCRRDRSRHVWGMSITGRLLARALPLIKLRSQLRAISLGVRGMVFDAGSGAVLLVKHSYIPGWHFPGGGVEPGETAVAALKRELAEEAGVALLAEPRLIGLFHNPQWTRGDHVAFFEAGPWEPAPRHPNIEIEAADFFPLDRLPADANASVRARLAERAGAPASLAWEGSSRPRAPSSSRHAAPGQGTVNKRDR